MSTHRRLRTLVAAGLAALLAALSLPCCGARVGVDGAGEPAGAGGGAAGGSSGDADAGPGAPAQCLCPDAPGYAPCVKPFECCPTVGVCKNPASFSCSGSAKTCP